MESNPQTPRELRFRLIALAAIRAYVYLAKQDLGEGGQRVLRDLREALDGTGFRMEEIDGCTGQDDS